MVGSRHVPVREFFHLLVDGRIKNMASIMGAGPLMVMETEVLGAHRSKPSYSTFDIIQGSRRSHRSYRFCRKCPAGSGS
jgi:hypothetical protein